MLLCLVSAAVARAQVPDWTEIALPGGRAALLPPLGVSPLLPRALVVQEIVRVTHASRDARSRPLKIVSDYFAKPPAAGDELVPLPLSPDVWRTHILSNAPADDRALLGAILVNRRASLLAYGLMSLDHETLAAIGGDATLLRQIYEQHATAFAAFAPTLRVRSGVLVLPGGSDLQPLWQSLLQSPLTSPREAITEVLGRDDGRLATFAEAVDNLDTAHQRLVRDDGIREIKDRAKKTAEAIAKEQAERSAQAFAALYQTFVDVEPAWKTSEFPFLRLGADPALLLAIAPIASDGQVAGTIDYWRAITSSDDLPDSLDGWSKLGDSDRIRLPELLTLLTPLSLPARQSTVASVAFASRLTARFPVSTPAQRAYLTRASRRFPALVLTLERADIRDWETWLALVRRARQLDRNLSDAGFDSTLTLFQAPIALVERALRAHALDRAKAESLLKELAAISSDSDGYGGEVAGWIVASLLPALGFQPQHEDVQAEGVLLEALSGISAPHGTIPVTVDWEQRQYRVDRAAPELARLTDVRASQEGNTLDTALTLAAIASALSGARELAQVRAAEKSLRDLAPAIVAIEPSELTSVEAPPDVGALLHQALAELERVRNRSDVKRAVSVGERLLKVDTAVLSDVLISIVYALSLGDPEGRTFLAGNVARRHDFGRHLVTPIERERTRWVLPFETAGDGEPWHVRGALLALDVGLGRLALRRTHGDLPELHPTISQADRKVLTDSLILTSSVDLDEGAARQIIEWLGAGRERLTTWTPGLQADTSRRLAIGERRLQAAAWTAAHDRQTLPQLFSLTELVLLGRTGDDELPRAWGVSRMPLDGSLDLGFPNPPAPQRYSGRSGAGLMATRLADVNLRVLDVLTRLRLPISLAPGVLAAALQDVLDNARLAYFDDWLSLSRDIQSLGDDAFSDYISALTARGPLVPAETDSGTDGHP